MFLFFARYHMLHLCVLFTMFSVVLIKFACFIADPCFRQWNSTT